MVLKDVSSDAALSSPITAAKAIKNEAELEGMRQAHLRDAAALANFWAWLEKLIVQEKKAISEVRVLLGNHRV